MTIQCCVCHKVKVQDEWIRPSQDHLGRVSHTYCPICLDRSLAAMRAERRLASDRVAPVAV